VNILTDSLVGESKEVAVLMGKFFRSLSEKQVCLYAGETTITVNGHGKGGRLQEYIAALISEIGSIKNCVAASFGSDGVDFLEGVGGAIIDDNTLMKCRANNIDIQSMIDENDTFNLHNQIGSLIKSSPTNTNVADLHVFIKE
jgi:hydroxypyruvate reductase